MAGTAVQHELTTEEIPNKLYFRIGDVSRIAGVKPYVLRYWESEFSMLGPKKSGTNHRLYRRKDVEMVLEIKRLLYEKRFTIEGARNFLNNRGKVTAVADKKAEKPQRMQAQLFATSEPVNQELVQEIRKELRDLLKILR